MDIPSTRETHRPYYKLRAGDYRAIITWNRNDDVLIVEAVGHRRNIYDRHLPP
nr:type II toxin-antitoxin system RelE/ParE family toxin [Haladaptatus sp. DYF46]